MPWFRAEECGWRLFRATAKTVQRSNGENVIPGRTEATKNKFSTHGPIAIAATKPNNPAKSLEYCATIGSLNPKTPPKRLSTFTTRSSIAPP